MSSYCQVSEGPVWMLTRYLYIYVCMYTYPYMWAFLVAQMTKNLLVMQETQVWSLRQEYPLEKEMATHSSFLVWRISWTEKPGRVQSMGSQRVGHDWAINTHVQRNVIGLLSPGYSQLWVNIVPNLIISQNCLYLKNSFLHKIKNLFWNVSWLLNFFILFSPLIHIKIHKWKWPIVLLHIFQNLWRCCGSPRYCQGNIHVLPSREDMMDKFEWWTKLEDSPKTVRRWGHSWKFCKTIVFSHTLSLMRQTWLYWGKALCNFLGLLKVNSHRVSLNTIFFGLSSLMKVILNC